MSMLDNVYLARAKMVTLSKTATHNDSKCQTKAEKTNYIKNKKEDLADIHVQLPPL